MSYLSSRCAVMHLHELAARVQAGTMPSRAVAVTFDDGYVDNLVAARPVLERAGVPATVFVSTGYTDSDCEFWWDELERIFFAAPRLPEILELPGVQGRRWQVGSRGERTEVFWSVHDLVRSLSVERREAVMEHLRDWSGEGKVVREHRRPMRRDELLSLASGSLVELGAHTVNHVSLPGLPAEIQRAEIDGARRALEGFLGRPVTAHANPFRHGSAATTEIVRALGFELACNGGRKSVESGTDVLELPRYVVGDLDARTFRRALEHHLVD